MFCVYILGLVKSYKYIHIVHLMCVDIGAAEAHRGVQHSYIYTDII
jgi:hypothetical protein